MESCDVARTMFGKRVDRMIRRQPWLEKVNLAFETTVMRAVWGVFGMMSPDMASRIGGGILAAIGPRLRKSRHVRANLRMALPNASEAEIERHVREVWETLGRAVAEYPHLTAIMDGRYGDRIEAVFEPGSEKESIGNVPAIFIGGHFGNWELSPSTVRLPDRPMVLIYSAQRNPQVDAMVVRWRSEWGPQYVTKDGSLSAMARALARGHSIGMLMDQRVDGGEDLPFFGHDAMTATVPLRLAVRQGLKIVPVRVERLNGVRFRVTAHSPIERDPTLTDPRDQARYLAGEINKTFERWITERPGQWMCVKQRWLDKPRRQNEAARAVDPVEA